VVKLKNRVFGRSPLNLRFRPGIAYELTFIKKGYQNASKRFTVTGRRIRRSESRSRRSPPEEVVFSTNLGTVIPQLLGPLHSRYRRPRPQRGEESAQRRASGGGDSDGLCVLPAYLCVLSVGWLAKMNHLTTFGCSRQAALCSPLSPLPSVLSAARVLRTKMHA